MPLYEYECTSCGHRQELLFNQPGDIEDHPLDVDCEKCGALARKIITARPTRPGENRDGNGIMDDHPGWLGPSDPRHPDSASRGLVSMKGFLSGQEAGIESRSQRAALIKKHGLREANE